MTVNGERHASHVGQVELGQSLRHRRANGQGLVGDADELERVLGHVAIVRQHQGWIECSSVVNQGTCFDTYLPRSREASGLTKAEAEELLDWLRANGCKDWEVAYKEGNGFLVRWQAR